MLFFFSGQACFSVYKHKNRSIKEIKIACGQKLKEESLSKRLRSQQIGQEANPQEPAILSSHPSPVPLCLRNVTNTWEA